MKASRTAALAALAAALLGACKYDPVPQEIIDDLGEEQGTPSATHRPGQPCLACHSAYGGAAPEFAVAGTLFTVDASSKLVPAAGVSVTIFDSAGMLRKACSNGAGNFFVERDNWPEITFPLAAQAGSRSMTSLIGRDGSCASCHKLPNGKSLDPVTGAAADSPGVILVDPTAAGASCGGAP